MIRSLLRQVRMQVVLSTTHRRVQTGKDVYIGQGTHIRPNAVRIGNHVSIGRYCQLGARDIQIGNYVMISSYVGIVDRNAHDPRKIGVPFMETSPTVSLPTIIGSDVWIGFGAILLSGVTIGEGAIVASGSVVVDDIPPYAIVASPKAKVISERFTPEQQELHKSKLNLINDYVAN